MAGTTGLTGTAGFAGAAGFAGTFGFVGTDGAGRAGMLAGAFDAFGGTFTKGAGTFLPSLTPAPPPGVAADPEAADPEAAALVAAALEVGVAFAVLPGVEPGTDEASSGTCVTEGALLAAGVVAEWAGAGTFSTVCRSCGLAA